MVHSGSLCPPLADLFGRGRGRGVAAICQLGGFFLPINPNRGVNSRLRTHPNAVLPNYKSIGLACNCKKTRTEAKNATVTHGRESLRSPGPRPSYRTQLPTTTLRTRVASSHTNSKSMDHSHTHSTFPIEATPPILDVGGAHALSNLLYTHAHIIMMPRLHHHVLCLGALQME